MLRPKVNEGIYLQANTLFDFRPKVMATQNVAFLHHVTHAAAKVKLLHQMIKEEIHLQENSTCDLTTRNVAQLPLHHVIYSPIKFEVATSNGLGGDA